MSKLSGTRHGNYEILNLIGYGLAKFEKALIANLGFQTKTAMFAQLIKRGVAKTVGTLKNRQDLFNPLVRGTKVGWWQNGDRYLHRKILLDSLFGDLDALEYAILLNFHLKSKFPIEGERPSPITPILKSKFRQLQETGSEAELFFMSTYRKLSPLKNGVLEDARLFGDGYDFQIALAQSFILVEVKGIRGHAGGIRLTENEYLKAAEYKSEYCLAVVSKLESRPQIALFFDPLTSVKLTKQSVVRNQVFYTSPSRRW